MRRFFVYSLGFFFSIFLSSFLLVFVLTSTIGSGERVKSWLEGADTVNLTVRNALFLVEGVELSDAVKKDIGETLVEPVGENLLKPQLYSAIDQFYGWLNASNYETLKISSDFSSNNREIRRAINQIVDKHFDELPTCDKNDRGDEVKLCVESDASSEKDRFADELFAQLSGRDGVLKKSSFTPDPKEGENDNFEMIYTINGIARSMLLWLPIAMLLATSAAIFIGRDRFASARIFARYVIGTLALPVLMSLLLFLLLPKEFTVTGELTDPASIDAMSTLVTPLIRTIIFSMVKTYLFIAVPLLITAIAGTVWLRRREKKLAPAGKTKK